MADISKYSDFQLKRLIARANFTPDLDATTKCVDMEYPNMSEWPMHPVGNMEVPDEEFYSLYTEALALVGKEIQDKAELVPEDGLSVPADYPAPVKENGDAFPLLDPDFLAEVLNQVQAFVMNGKNIEHETILTNIGMTEEAGIRGDGAVPALYLASVTALLWTLYALDSCDTAMHVGWHQPEDHSAVYVKMAQVIKTQTRVAQNVLKGPDFAALAASVKAAAKRRLDLVTFPDNSAGKSSPTSPASVEAKAAFISSKKWEDANRRNSSVEKAILAKAKKLGQLTLQEALAASQHLLVTRSQQMKVTKVSAGGGIKLSAQVAATAIETTTALREAAAYLGRVYGAINREFGMLVRTEFVDAVLEAAKSFGISCAVLYGNMVLSNLHTFINERASEWRTEFPGSECPDDMLYQGIDFQLNEVMLSHAKREAETFRETQKTLTPGGKGGTGKGKGRSPGQRPPQHQPGADGKNSNPVGQNAKPRGTSEASKQQPCYNHAQGSPCKFFDAATSRCPFVHENSASSGGRPKGKGKNKRQAASAETQDVSSAEELDH